MIALTIEARTPTTLWVGYVERSKPDSMMLHSAKMAGRMLVNVRLGGDGDAWVLGRLRVLDPTVFRLDVLSADIPDTTSVARQKLIERAIRDDSFDDGFLCRRPTESRQ